MSYGHETRSETAGNYGAAVLLVSGALFCIAVGVGYLKESLFPKEEEEDIGDFFTKKLNAAVKDKLMEIRGARGDGDIVQDTLETPITFYVKKAYKHPVAKGDLIPDSFLAVKTDSISDSDWKEMDNIKFTSTRRLCVSGKAVMFEVGELITIQ